MQKKLFYIETSETVINKIIYLWLLFGLLYTTMLTSAFFILACLRAFLRMTPVTMQ